MPFSTHINAVSGLIVDPGVVVHARDDGKPYENTTASAITLTGENAVDLTGQGLTVFAGSESLFTGDGAIPPLTNRVVTVPNDSSVTVRGGNRQEYGIGNINQFAHGLIKSDANQVGLYGGNTSPFSNPSHQQQIIAGGDKVRLRSNTQQYELGDGAGGVLPLDQAGQTVKPLVIDQANGRLLQGIAGPSPMQVPTVLDVGNAATFTLPTGAGEGAGYCIENAPVTGVALGTANPITAHNGDKVFVKSGVTSSTDNGADFVKFDNNDAVSSVQVGSSGSPTLGAVVIPDSANGVKGVIALEDAGAWQQNRNTASGGTIAITAGWHRSVVAAEDSSTAPTTFQFDNAGPEAGTGAIALFKNNSTHDMSIVAGAANAPQGTQPWVVGPNQGAICLNWAGNIFSAFVTSIGDFLADGSVPLTGDMNLGGNKVTALGDGTTPTDAVTKQQLDVASDVFSYLSQWTPIDAPVVVHGNSLGIPSAVLEDADVVNFGGYGLENNVPVTSNQTVRIRIVRDPAKTNALAVRHGDPVNGFTDLYIRTDTGETDTAAVNVVGTTYVPPTVLATHVTDQTIEVLATFAANPNGTGWSLGPAISQNVTPTTTDGALTGTVEVLEIDLNHDPLAGTNISTTSVLNATDITLNSGATTLVYNVADPATGQVSVLDGSISRFSDKALFAFEVRFDEDGTFVLDLANAMPVGGKILSLNATTPNASHDPFADISLARTGDTLILINRSDSIDADVLWHLAVIVGGYPDLGIVVPVGTATPTTIQTVVGYADVGDILSPGTPTFTAGFANVTAQNEASGTRYGFTFTTAFANADYMLQVTVEERTLTSNQLNDISVAVVSAKSATGFSLFFEETSPIAQDLRIHVFAAVPDAFVDSSIIAPGATTVTEWTSYGPLALSATTTPPTKGSTTVDTAFYKVVGKSLHVQYTFKQTSSGTSGSGTYLFPLPAGFTINAGIVNMDEPSGGTVLGVMEGHSAGNVRKPGVVKAANTTALWLQIADPGTTSTNRVGSGSGLTLDFVHAGTTEISFSAEIPIL